MHGNYVLVPASQNGRCHMIYVEICVKFVTFFKGSQTPGPPYMGPLAMISENIECIFLSER